VFTFATRHCHLTNIPDRLFKVVQSPVLCVAYHWVVAWHFLSVPYPSVVHCVSGGITLCGSVHYTGRGT
jgi:hypothetical protein